MRETKQTRVKGPQTKVKVESESTDLSTHQELPGLSFHVLDSLTFLQTGIVVGFTPPVPSVDDWDSEGGPQRKDKDVRVATSLPLLPPYQPMIRDFHLDL